MRGSTSEEKTVLGGFFSLLGSQLLARIVTFLLNLVAARLLSPDEYGISAVQFHLINSSIVFLSREGVRRSCLRIVDDGKEYSLKLLSTALLVIPVGMVISLASIGLLVGYQPHNIQDEGYVAAATMQCIAAMVELISEPFFIFATSRMWFGVRTGCEAFSNVLKNFVTVSLLAFGSVAPTMAVSWGQMAYSIGLVVSFVLCFSVLEPSWVNALDVYGWRRVYIEKHVLRLYWAFSLQALGKLVLAEGSKAVLALVTSTSVQGVYGLVNNLGSLVVRTLFQPFEEIVFVAFSKEGGATNKKTLTKQVTMLTSLCMSITIIGCLSASFGPAYSYVVLKILYGETWAATEAPAALSLYSIFVALLALNGTLEAFLHGVASESYLHRNNIVLVISSMIHVGLSIGAVTLYGAVGLLLADSFNMLLRIGYCLLFVRTYFAQIGGMTAVRVIPSKRTVVVLLASALLSKVSQYVFLPETMYPEGQDMLVVQVFHRLIPPSTCHSLASLLPASMLHRMAMHIGFGGALLAAGISIWAKEGIQLLATLRKIAKND